MEILIHLKYVKFHQNSTARQNCKHKVPSSTRETNLSMKGAVEQTQKHAQCHQ